MRANSFSIRSLVAWSAVCAPAQGGNARRNPISSRPRLITLLALRKTGGIPVSRAPTWNIEISTARHHRSVQDAYYEHGPFDPNAFDQDAFQVGKLTIKLQDQAATRFGESIGCVELARKLLEFWEGYDKLAV